MQYNITYCGTLKVVKGGFARLGTYAETMSDVITAG